MKKSKLFLALSVVLLSTSTMALDYLVEPYVGYSRSEWEEENTAEYDMHSPVLGSRLGIKIEALSFGIDYSMNRGNLRNEKTDAKEDYLGSQFGIFVGHQLTDSFNYRFTYNRRVNFEDRDGAGKGDEYSGYGYGLGISYTGIKAFNINFDYKHNKLKEFTNGKTDSESNLQNRFIINQIVLSISFPISF